MKAIDRDLDAFDVLAEAVDLRGEREYTRCLEQCEATRHVLPDDPRLIHLHDKVDALKDAFELLTLPLEQRASEESIRCLQQALDQPRLDLEASMDDVLRDEQQRLEAGLAESRKALSDRLSREAVETYRSASGPRRRVAYQEAEAKLRQALALQPDNQASLEANLAAVREKLQPLQEADEFAALGQDALGDGEYETAVRHFEAAMARDAYHQPAEKGLDRARDGLEVQQALSLGEAALAAKDYAQAVGQFELAQSLAGKKYPELRRQADDRLAEAERQQEAQGGYEWAYSQGSQALAVQDFELAQEFFEQALERRPGDARAQAGLRSATSDGQALADMLGRVTAAMSEQPPALDVAQRFATQAVTRFGQSAEAQKVWLDTLLCVGRTRLEQGSYDGALKAFEAVLARLPEQAQALNGKQEVADRQKVAGLKKKGQAAMARGRFGEAEAHFVEALAAGEIYPDLAAELQTLVDQAHEANEARDKVAQFTARAQAAREAKDWAALVAHAEQALRLDPAAKVTGWVEEARQAQQEANSLHRAGQDALTRGAYEEAVAALERAYEVWPGQEMAAGLAQAGVAWGESLLRGERWAEAGEAFGRALRVAPEDEAARRGQQTARDLPDVERLVVEGRQALDEPGRAEVAVRALEEAAVRAAGYEERVEAVTSLLEQAREAAERERQFAAAQREALQAHQAGQPEEVIRWLEEALAQRPDDAETLRLLEQSRREQSTFDEALQQGQAALARARQAYEDGRDREAPVALAEAARHLSAAREVYPQHAGLAQVEAQVDGLGRLLDLVETAGKQQQEGDLEGAVALLAEAARQHPDEIRLASLLRERSAELERQRQIESKRLRDQADKAWGKGQWALARDLYSQVWTLTGDLTAKARADEVDADEQRRRRVQQLADQGETYLKQADYLRAIESLHEAVGLLLADGEVDAEAATAVRQAIDEALIERLNDESKHDAAWDEMRRHMSQAESHAVTGRDTRRLVEVARRLIEARRRNAMLSTVRSAMVAEQYDKAVREAERVLKLDPGNEKLIEEYGSALNALVTFQDERAGRRIQAAQTALKDGDYAQALTQLRETLNLLNITQGVRDEAERLLHQAQGLQVVAERVVPLLAEAKAYLDQGQYEPAIAALEKAQREDPEKRAGIEARQVEELLAVARQRRQAMLERQAAEGLNAARARLAAARNEAAVDEALAGIHAVLVLLPEHTPAQELLNAALEKKSRFEHLAELKEAACTALDDGQREDKIDEALLLLEEARGLGLPDTELAALLSEAQQRQAAAKRQRMLLEQGQAALASKDYSQAIDALGQLYGLAPANEEVLRLLRQAQAAQAMQQGENCLTAEQYEQAVSAFRQATELEPENSPAKEKLREAHDKARLRQEVENLVSQARAALQVRHYPGAKDYLTRALRQEPRYRPALELKEQVAAAERQANDAEQVIKAARQALQAHRYDEAIAECRKALAKDARNPDALSLREQAERERDRSKKMANLVARIRQALDDQRLDQARADADKLRELDAEHRELRDFYARIRDGEAELRRWEEQLDQAQFLVDWGTQEQWAEALHLLEGCLRDGPASGKEQAEKLLLQCRAQQAKQEQVMASLAEAEGHRQGGHYVEAMAALQGVLALIPDHFEATQQRAELEQRQERVEAADRLVQEAQQALADHVLGQAEQKCDQALVLMPEHKRGLKLRAEITASRQQSLKVLHLLTQSRAELKALRPADMPQLAMGFVDEVLTLDPDNQEGLELKSQVLAQQRHAEQLRDLIETARERNQAGDYEAALVALDKLAAIDRTNEEAKRLQAQVQRSRDRAAEVERHVQDGRSHFHASKYAEAITAYRRALAARPDEETEIRAALDEAQAKQAERVQADASFKQAKTYLDVENYNEAIPLLQKVRAVRPDDTSVAELLHKAEAGQKNEQQIAEILSEARPLLDNSPQAALDLLAKGLAIKSTDPNLQTLFAQADAMIKQEQKLDANLRLAREAAETGQYQAANDALADVKAIAPHHPELRVLESLVDCLAEGEKALDGRDYPRALGLFSDAYKLNSANRRLSHLQAQAREQAGLLQGLQSARKKLEAGQYQAAMGELRDILSCDPDYPEAKQEAAELGLRLVEEASIAKAASDYTTARRYLDWAWQLCPQDESVRKLRESLTEEVTSAAGEALLNARKALEKNDLSAAREAVERGLARVPESEQLKAMQTQVEERERQRRDADALVARGRELLRAADYGNAATHFDKALQTDPPHWEAPKWAAFTARLKEGLDLIRRQSYGEAASILEQAVQPFQDKAGDLPELAEARRWQQEATEREATLEQMRQLLGEARRLKTEGQYDDARRKLMEMLTIRFPDETLIPVTASQES